jgi:hypothetical protein
MQELEAQANMRVRTRRQFVRGRKRALPAQAAGATMMINPLALKGLTRSAVPVMFADQPGRLAT